MKKRLFLALALGLVLVAGLLLWVGQRKPAEEPLELSTEPLRIKRYHGGVSNDLFSLIPQSELDHLFVGNPWSPDSELEALPVFKTPYAPSPQIEAAVTEKVYAIADQLNLAITPKDSSWNSYVFDGGDLWCRSDGVVMLSYRPLPSSFSKRLQGKTTKGNTFEEKKEVGNYFLKKYARTFGVKDPQISAPAGVLTSYSTYIGFHSGSGTLAEQITAFHFQRVDFFLKEDHLTICFQYAQLPEEIGMYPVISVEKAQQMLKDGSYSNNPGNSEDPVAESPPSAENIVFTTLLYDTYHYDTAIPFYLFYAPSESRSRVTGETLYRVYYVPAIDLSYIENPEIFGPGFEQYAD